MRDLIERAKLLWSNRQGAMFVEWALLAALVVIVCATVVIALNAHGPGEFVSAARR